MANFKLELSNDIIKEMNNLEKSVEKMASEMTTAAAKVVEKNIRSSVPDSFKKSQIMKCLKISRTYKTPSDGGINNKVMFVGYFKNHLGKKTPAPLIVNIFEYGRSNFKKKPFFRKSFKKSQIEQTMKAVQEKYIKEE